MKTSFIVILLCTFVFLVSLDSCKKDETGKGSVTSGYGGTQSHNVGEACMSCHNSGGSNKYWFTVAGTVYKPDSTDLNPNGTVYLFSAPSGSGTMTYSFQVDGKANFFTTDPASFGNGLYPAVKSPSGQVKYMNSFITQGDCNSCHNKGNRIVVN
jgi:hypothetical protein